MDRGPRTVLLVEAVDAFQPRAANDQAALVREALQGMTDVEVVSVGAHGALHADIERIAPGFVVPCVAPGGPDEVRLVDLLELIGVPFAGSPAGTRRICSDKVAAKRIAELAGLACLAHHVVGGKSIVGWGVRPSLAPFVSATRQHGVVIKPVHGTGARGVRRAGPDGDLAFGLTSSLSYDAEIMLEPFVAGREFSVIVTGPAEQPQVFGVAEVAGSVAVATASAHAPHWERRFTAAADVPPGLRDDACTVYRALGCRDAASVDFMVDADGRTFFLEVDTALDCAFGGRVACAAAAEARPAADVMARFVERLLAAG